LIKIVFVFDKSTHIHPMGAQRFISSITIEKLKRGDTGAFNEIFRLYSRRTLNLARKYLLCREDAEEIMQDVFVKLWNTRKTIDPSKNFDNLIFTIAKNAILDRIKRYSTEQKHLELYFRETNPENNETENDILRNDLAKMLEDALTSLPPKRRNIFEMNRLQGMTYREIAKKLNLSSTMVEKQMSKALKAIKEKLSGFKIFLLWIVVLF